jgi:hypothetical protein
MRHVGCRDEARLTADYEKCGQYCCCKNFLKVLKPVSMKSAKIQKATLDPLKISGRCGRLMCCLRYEDETYDELRKKLPKKKSRRHARGRWPRHRLADPDAARARHASTSAASADGKIRAGRDPRREARVRNARVQIALPPIAQVPLQVRLQLQVQFRGQPQTARVLPVRMQVVLVLLVLLAGLRLATATTTSRPTRSTICFRVLMTVMKVDQNRVRRRVPILRIPMVRVASVAGGVVAVAADPVAPVVQAREVPVQAAHHLLDLRARPEALRSPFTRSSPSAAAFGTLARSAAVAAFFGGMTLLDPGARRR